MRHLIINLVMSVRIGAIVTARKFDRERQREYAVTVTATDQAADPLIGICQLNILILDQNDNSPKFENIRYECKCCCVLRLTYLLFYFSRFYFEYSKLTMLPDVYLLSNSLP